MLQKIVGLIQDQAAVKEITETDDSEKYMIAVLLQQKSVKPLHRLYIDICEIINGHRIRNQHLSHTLLFSVPL